MREEPLREETLFLNCAVRARGASLVEAALVLPVFILIVFFLIDISNYFYRYIVISYAVGAGADLACKYPMELKTDPDWCSEARGHRADCETYRRYLKSVLIKTEELADAVSVRIGDAPNPVSATLVRRNFTHYYESTPQDQRILGDRPLITAGAALLRPGEKVRRDDGLEINHPSLPYPAPNATPPAGWPLPGTGTTWTTVLDKYPVVVRIEADYEPLTPFMPRIPMMSQGLCYRKMAASGRPPRPYAPSNLPPPDDPPIGPTPPSPVQTSGITANPTPGQCTCCYDNSPCPGTTDKESYCQGCDSGAGGHY